MASWHEITQKHWKETWNEPNLTKGKFQKENEENMKSPRALVYKNAFLTLWFNLCVP